MAKAWVYQVMLCQSWSPPLGGERVVLQSFSAQKSCDYTGMDACVFYQDVILLG